MSSHEKEILNSFLLQSPPCEYVELVKDLKSIVSDHKAIECIVPDSIVNYCNTNCLLVETEGKKIILTKYNQVEKTQNEYYDPVNQQIHKIDFYQMKVIESRPFIKENTDLEILRKNVQQHLRSYTDEKYPLGSGMVLVNGQKLKIVISAIQNTTKNFCTGRWKSVWNVTLNSSNVEVTGSVEVFVHYYEDANIQMRNESEKKFSVGCGTKNDAFPKNLIKSIAEVEERLHSQLDVIFSTMNDTTFKSLRRQLPVSREKINWANWRGAKMVASK
ncbi:F-actin-capping protein subunit alpha, putative [Entamoeba invadens IP1]|uniref:F-actin-capping protein subunit alpha, putative n=1 Tax=Entamoeba invadens IP1 TaxID=370355 RepID=UPI0002C3DFE7|nr:F-actin-capping protein subunit alpha, putative [Entamoeba invadens IP1]ELP90377.1 F-actin-capping protein subunit alpha, putative [Entamoeba invadens IP1]|eukprot:XP_004257148.1 F-actin-capping protein subunit alpha, putative [Entamoeba invadens IP1]